MSYLITEMLFFLLVTAVLGAITGWLAKGLLASRRHRLHEETWRRELRRSEARAGNLKNQLAESFLVEERLREEVRHSAAVAPAEGTDTEAADELRAELARRDKKIKLLKLQLTQSKAALASEWQSLKALKSELAERQERLAERGKQVSGKLRSSEETRQQLRLQLRAMKRQTDRLQEELATVKQALADERWESSNRIAKLETKLEEQQTMVALLSVEEEASSAEEPTATEETVAAEEEADEPTVVEETAAAEEPAVEEPVAEAPVADEPDDLSRIRGIGPVLHRKLNDAGVSNFRQIAAWTDDDVVQIARRIRVGAGRIRRDGWIEAARGLESMG